MVTGERPIHTTQGPTSPLQQPKRPDPEGHGHRGICDHRYSLFPGGNTDRVAPLNDSLAFLIKGNIGLPRDADMLLSGVTQVN